jgi:hypothetical protein
MAIKRKTTVDRCKKHIQGHPSWKKAKKMIDKFEDDMAEKIADKVVHELKESGKKEKREHKTGKHKTHKG